MRPLVFSHPPLLLAFPSVRHGGRVTWPSRGAAGFSIGDASASPSSSFRLLPLVVPPPPPCRRSASSPSSFRLLPVVVPPPPRRRSASSPSSFRLLPVV